MTPYSHCCVQLLGVCSSVSFSVSSRTLNVLEVTFPALVHFKVAVIIYKTRHGLTPSYLADNLESRERV